MSIKRVNPEMITLAREAVGFTQAELATAAGMSQGKLSKYENGLLSVSSEDAAAIARALNCEAELLYQTDRIYGLGSSSLFHRQRQSAPMSVQRQIQARINILRMQVDRLLRGVEIESEYTFQAMDVEAFDGDVERIASMLRVAWQMPLGPISSVTAAIENAGGIVLKCNFGTNKIDAAHIWVAGLPPLFFMNGGMPADRYRFTLAHELGHAVMHRAPTGDIEAEADRFAAEFLMPAKEIRPHLAGLNIQRAASLKPHWKVSMAALVRRGRDVGAITQRHYHTLFQRLSALGYRTNEPIELAHEEPLAFRHLVQVYQQAHGYSREEIDKLLFSSDSEFFAWHGLEAKSPLRIVTPPRSGNLRLSQ
jgi:Zn-dependent peptidase ImmA (M78 family)/transcriptional regulator with XRE-family HTH domain